jgi:hypothetical protein
LRKKSRPFGKNEYFYLYTSRTSQNQKGLGLPGNSKAQIPNKGVSFGQILNAFGEEHTAAFLSLKSWG